jgi:capsular polysaccharide biosynthesis protein
MELKEYLLVLYRWIWLIVLGTLAAMVSSYLVFRYYTPWPPYEATATVMIIGDDTLGLDTVQAIRATYAELAGRRPVSQAVVDGLALPMSADELEELIKVNPVGYTRLLEISVKYHDAQQAAAIANEIARQLSQFSLSGRRQPARDTSAWVITEAQVPARPSLGSYMGILVAGVTGFTLAVGAVVLIEYLGGKIRMPQDVERSLRLPVLGTVKYLSNARRSAFSRLLQRHREKREPEKDEEKAQEMFTASPPFLSKTYQWICFRLCHLEDGPPQKLLIISPDALAGQSTLAAGLATAWAETGQKAVLVDAHLLRPVVSQWFGFSNDGGSSFPHEHDGYQRAQERERVASMEGAKPAALLNPPGDVEPRASKEKRVPLAHRPLLERVAEMGPPPLARRARLILAWDDGAGVRELQERVGYSRSRVYHWLRYYRLYGLQIFYEQAHVHSSELSPTRVDSEGTVSEQKPKRQNVSASQRQLDALDDDVLDDLSRQANVVIVDSPPILATPNAAILASKMDGILLVLGAGKTRVKAAQETIRILEAVGGKILGTVLLS